jgi:sugar lactone lactonase YvrE
MPIRSILFPVVPSILVAAVAGCAVEPGAVDDESVQRAASAAPVRHRPHVLVANSRGDNIVGYAEDGAPLGDFIPPGRDGLDDPDTMLIGPDHRLYVTSGAEPDTSAVLRFDARTGAFLGVFASGHGLHRPYGLAFGDDGLLYVASFMTDEIFRFDAATGAFVDVFSHGDGKPGGLNGPNSLVFGPMAGCTSRPRAAWRVSFPACRARSCGSISRPARTACSSRSPSRRHRAWGSSACSASRSALTATATAATAAICS